VKFLKWLTNIDRRIIFLLMIGAVLVPMLFTIPIPFEVGEPVQKAFNAIDTLKPGSVIMFSVDYDATSYPECQPMIVAITNHAFRKDLRIILLGHIPTGLPLGQEAVERGAAEYNQNHEAEYQQAVKHAGEELDKYTAGYQEALKTAAAEFDQEYTLRHQETLNSLVFHYLEEVDSAAIKFQKHTFEYWKAVQYAGEDFNRHAAEYQKGLKGDVREQNPGYVQILERAAAEYDKHITEYQEALEHAADQCLKRYGIDFVNLGYRPGMVPIIVGMGREIRDFYRQDYQNINVDSLPMMVGVHNYDDVAILASFAHGIQVETWIAFAGARFGQQIIGGVTGVVAPDLYPYLQSGQLAGFLGGLKGASEYESLIEKKGLATRGMPAQSTAHILVIILIVIGSIAEFAMDLAERRRRR